MKKVWGAFRIVGNVLLYIFLAFALFSVVLSIATKKDADGAATMFGKQMRIIRSDSMSKCEQTDVSKFEIKDLPVKTLILIETVPENGAAAEAWYAALEEGDVLTFRYKYTEQVTITHRIVRVTEKADGGYLIELAGDNKASEDALTQIIDTSKTESFNYVIGKVVWASFPLGWLVYALRTPVVVVCLIILPCLIIIAFEIFKIVSVLGEGKREKAAAEAQKKEDEIEELKRRLAELEDKEKKEVDTDGKTV